MGIKVNANKIPAFNQGKIAGKKGVKVTPPTKSMQSKLDKPSIIKALQTLQVHYK